MAISKSSIKKLYSAGNARWYDTSKILWSKILAPGAEAELRTFLQRNVNQSTTILDLGCGTASNLNTIKSLHLNFKSYLGVDLSQEMIARAREKFAETQNIKFLQGDIEQFKQFGSFDVILCTWVLEHIQDRADFVNNLGRHMKKKSKLFLLFYSRPKWYLNYTLFPFIRFLFKSSARDVSSKEIKKFRQVKTVHSYSGSMITTVQIEA